MTRLALLASVLLLVGGFVVADDKTPNTKAPATASHGRGSLPTHWGRLGLSDDQKQKVRTIRDQYRAQLDDLDRQMKELRKKEHAEMEAVLTDSQKQRLREIMTEGAPAAPGDKGDKKP